MIPFTEFSVLIRTVWDLWGSSYSVLYGKTLEQNFPLTEVKQ